MKVLILYGCSAGFSWSEADDVVHYAAEYDPPIGECVVIEGFEAKCIGTTNLEQAACWLDY